MARLVSSRRRGDDSAEKAAAAATPSRACGGVRRTRKRYLPPFGERERQWKKREGVKGIGGGGLVKYRGLLAGAGGSQGTEDVR